MTLSKFDALFPNEEACRTYLMLRRWPAGPHCPRCNNDKLYESTARPWHWQCMKCGPKPRSRYRFALTTGTIFEQSKKPLLMWFKVLRLMVTRKKGISALQVHRMRGTGSVQTAWYMWMSLRAGMKDPEFRQLMGIVEVDETYLAKSKPIAGSNPQAFSGPCMIQNHETKASARRRARRSPRSKTGSPRGASTPTT